MGTPALAAGSPFPAHTLPLTMRFLLPVLFLAPLAPFAGAQEVQPLGPLGGSAQSVLVHPLDSTRVLSSTSFPEAVTRRSDDGGLSWFDASAGLPFGAWAADFTSDPLDPDRVYGLFGSQIYVSPDFGGSWSPLPLTATDSLRELAVDSTGFGMLALTSTELWRSADGGTTWTLVRSGIVVGESVAIAPSDPSVAYLGHLSGVERSDDGGLTWTPTSSASWSKALLVDPTTSDVVYSGGSGGLFFRSDDGGVTWTSVGSGYGGGSVQDMKFDPADPTWSTLLVGGLFGLWTTPDRGATWSQVPAGPPVPLSTGVSAHADGTWYLASENGFFRRLAGETGMTQVGFQEVELWGIAMVREGGERVAWNWNGVYAATADGLLEPTNFFFDFGASTEVLAVDPEQIDRWLSGGVGSFIDNAQIRVLTGGGAQSVIVYEMLGAGTVVDLEFDSFLPDRVLAGIDPASFGSMGLLVSQDGGDTWSEVPASLGFAVRAVAWDPHASGHALAAGPTGSTLETQDGGLTWSSGPAFGAGSDLRFLAFDPFEPGVLYLGDGGAGLQRSDDGGISWTPLGVALHTRSHLTFGNVPGLMWVSDAAGNLLESLDGGSTWAVKWTVPGGLISGHDLDTGDGSIAFATLASSAFEMLDAAPFLQVGEGLAGDGGFVPRHYGADPAEVGGSVTLVGDRFMPGILATLAVSLTPGEQPFAGGTAWLSQPLLTQLQAQTTGTAGVPGTGRVEFTLQVPAQSGLVGLRAWSQIFGQDPAAVQGISMTPGLTTILQP